MCILLQFYLKTVKIYLFIYLFIAVLGLHCCIDFSLVVVVASRGYSLVALCGLLIVVASLVAEHRLQFTQASVVVVHGLSSCNFCFPGKSPTTEEPGGLQSIGSQRVGHD